MILEMMYEDKGEEIGVFDDDIIIHYNNDKSQQLEIYFDLLESKEIEIDELQLQMVHYRKIKRN